MDESFIAKRLAELRIEMGVSARDMSLSIGQAHNYVSNIENGKSFPSIQGLLYICEYMKITPKEFFDEGNNNPAMLNELVEELKPHSSKTIEYILGLVRELSGK